MKKATFNISSIKKHLDKNPLNYAEYGEKIACWNKRGTFVIIVSKLVFETEIKNTLPTVVIDLPSCIPTTIKGFSDNESVILSHTFLTMQLNNIDACLFQNIKYKYITPIDNKLLSILNNIEDFTPYQIKENTSVLFKNEDISVLIFPLFNRDIANKLKSITDTLK